MKATLPVSGPRPSRRLLAQAPQDEGISRLWRSKTRAWSGKVETGFPSRQTRNAFARRPCSNKGM